MDNNTSSISNSIPLDDITTATTLFAQEAEVNKKFYRIPALIYICKEQTYLAFAEKRKTPDDADAEVLVMKRGLWKNDKEVEWDSGHLVLNSALLLHHRSMNPCPVYEKDSDTLFLFFICIPIGVSENDQKYARQNQAQLCYITSKDTGRSWSDVTNLKDVISEKEKNWATFAVGPGHGVQMENGRLIIPAYVYYFDSEKCCSLCCSLCCSSCCSSCYSSCCSSCCSLESRAFAFYSDDKGSTWHVGKQMEDESGECQMAEIKDDSATMQLYCNARSTSGHRVEALSKDRGETFNKLTPAPLTETGEGCQGSVLKMNFPDQSTWLLYSHPFSECERKDLEIYVNKSQLDPIKWEPMQWINEGPSGYSDLAECGDQKYFACLFECGRKSYFEKINFKLSDINNTMNLPSSSCKKEKSSCLLI